jgi:hypothetical protein
VVVSKQSRWPGNFPTGKIIGMFSGPVYCLVAVREDGRRNVIATGLSEETAALMHQIITTEMPATQIDVEPERKGNLPSDGGLPASGASQNDHHLV